MMSFEAPTTWRCSKAIGTPKASKVRLCNRASATEGITDSNLEAQQQTILEGIINLSHNGSLEFCKLQFGAAFASSFESKQATSGQKRCGCTTCTEQPFLACQDYPDLTSVGAVLAATQSRPLAEQCPHLHGHCHCT